MSQPPSRVGHQLSQQPAKPFYNATPGTDESLAASTMPFVADNECCNVEDLVEEGHVMLEFAAWQLEDLGIVRITFLDETLIDGERDFQIELTDKGAHVLADGLEFRFRHAEDSISATPASERLISFLEARGTLTLREVMEFGHSHSAIVIKEHCGNEYHLGTRTYAWAFEVSLWHHARAGNIEPGLQTAEEEKLWSDFVSKTGRPSRPDISTPQPLWDIPFRLSDAFCAGKGKINHVGNLS